MTLTQFCSRSLKCAFFALAALLVSGAPRPALADIPSDRAEFFMYGRMGIGWVPTGQLAPGLSMNLGDRNSIGGRLEDGDYLEPGMRLHLLKGDNDRATRIDIVTSFEMFSLDGSIVSDLANRDAVNKIKFFPEQAYVEAYNVLTEGLTLWAGSRLYRAADVHIANYFYFNNLPSTGVGARYAGLDVAILQITSGSPFYRASLGSAPIAADAPTVQRPRTVGVAQYKLLFGPRESFVQALGEIHFVPKAKNAITDETTPTDPFDYGWVAGLKLHLDLDGGDFNDTSVRYGTRIANGGFSGRTTFDTFGASAQDGTYKGAYGVEAVDHFLVNFGQIFAVNGYAVLGYSQGARDYTPMAPNPPDPTMPFVIAPDTGFSFGAGARPTLYVTDQFHLSVEGTFQARKDEGRDLGTAVKLSAIPTIVPSGKRSVWTRPALRLIYTACIYNQAAVDQRMSPYLQTVGPKNFGQYIGLATEWWY